MDNQNILKVRILSPKKIIFEGMAISVSSKNSAGKFDVLPFHANFISFIENSPIIVNKTDGVSTQFSFPFAIFYLTNNQVNIYTGIQSEISEVRNQSL